MTERNVLLYALLKELKGMELQLTSMMQADEDGRLHGASDREEAHFLDLTRENAAKRLEAKQLQTAITRCEAKKVEAQRQVAALKIRLEQSVLSNTSEDDPPPEVDVSGRVGAGALWSNTAEEGFPSLLSMSTGEGAGAVQLFSTGSPKRAAQLPRLSPEASKELSSPKGPQKEIIFFDDFEEPEKAPRSARRGRKNKDRTRTPPKREQPYKFNYHKKSADFSSV